MPANTLTDRSLIRLSGDDVRGFLQGLVTNDVTGPLPVYAALLSAQGKCLFDFLVWDDHEAGGDDLLIDCEAAQADALAKRLTLYRLRRPISIVLEKTLSVHWCSPAEAGAHHQNSRQTLAVEQSASPGDGPRSESRASDRPSPGNRVGDPRLATLGHRWLGRTTDGDGSAAYRAHRLSLGVTEGVAELGSGETLWLECNAAELHGVSFTKGCYVGQENTARMNWRSTVNRRLVVVPLAEADPKRQTAAYLDLGLSVEHRRLEGIPAHAWRDWMGERTKAE